MHRRLLLTLLLLVLALLGCGGEEEPSTELSVFGYAYHACYEENPPPDPVRNDDTWGEVKGRWQERLERMERTTPPESLKDYHLAAIAYLRVVLNEWESLDDDTAYNPYEDKSDDSPVVGEQVILLRRAFGDLWRDSQAVLRAARCTYSSW